jgi:phosphoglycerate dehydrogenase-like enzyme
MRILVYLRSAVSVFQASEAQVAQLAARLPRHTLARVTSKDELVAGLAEADAVVVWSFPAKWYEMAPRLQHVFTPAAGRERIQPDPRREVELHFGQFHGTMMAESLLAMILFMNRRFGVALDHQRAHAWEPSAYESTRRLAVQTALIVGYGAVGRRAAELLSAVGMQVHGLKRDVGRGAAGVARLFARDELYDALALADHVACILPGDTGTDHLLDAAAFQRMKHGAFVYNLGRGNAIDHAALVDALGSGALGGAFLDVWPAEPLPADSPLWDVPHLFLTPHASAIYEDYLGLYFDELALLVERLTGR